MAEKIKRDNYCKDCKRSIYGEYKNCDVNIENNGKYVGPPNQECGCKIAEVTKSDEVERSESLQEVRRGDK